IKAVKSDEETVYDISDKFYIQTEITGIINLLDKYSLRIYPNPVSSNSTIDFEIMNLSKVSITIYNSAGQRIDEIANGYYKNGMYSLTINGTNLNNGIYYCQVKINMDIITQKFIINH
ncbi:MAG: T9SS type A sorting domain-containing protein, partial [Bacteroidales bacterium]|nr:T9SS type A sorting domain-containing protein [Bacteroidales bacterium]